MANYEKLAELRQALAAGLTAKRGCYYGVESVDFCVEDVDGDWWEIWRAGKEAGNGRSPIATEPS